MWANAQCDGRPVDHSGALCSTPQSLKAIKLAGVPQTGKPTSAASGPKFTILWGHLEEVLLLNKFFFRLSIRVLVAKIWPDKVVRWCADGDVLAIFCILHFQRAPCSTFQTCILNSH